jgi:hypothetical protein
MKARRGNRRKLLLRRAAVFRQSRNKTLLFLPPHPTTDSDFRVAHGVYTKMARLQTERIELLGDKP